MVRLFDYEVITHILIIFQPSSTDFYNTHPSLALYKMLQQSMRTSSHIISVRAKAQMASTITRLGLITRTQVRTWNELRMVKRVSTLLRAP